jgi:hypothetical protein
VRPRDPPIHFRHDLRTTHPGTPTPGLRRRPIVSLARPEYSILRQKFRASEADFRRTATRIGPPNQMPAAEVRCGAGHGIPSWADGEKPMVRHIQRPDADEASDAYRRSRQENLGGTAP